MCVGGGSFCFVRVLISLFDAPVWGPKFEALSYPLGPCFPGRKVGSEQARIHQERFQFTAVAYQSVKSQNLYKWTGK